MKQDYRGFELSARREKSLGGDTLLYYYIMRKSDGWFLEDSFTSGAETAREYMKYLKDMVDDYLINPLDRYLLSVYSFEELISDMLESFTPEQIGNFFGAYAKKAQAEKTEENEGEG